MRHLASLEQHSNMSAAALLSDLLVSSMPIVLLVKPP